MQHDLFSSLDSFLSVPAGSGGLLIRDVTGQYRPAVLIHFQSWAISGRIHVEI